MTVLRVELCHHRQYRSPKVGKTRLLPFVLGREAYQKCCIDPVRSVLPTCGNAIGVCGTNASEGCVSHTLLLCSRMLSPARSQPSEVAQVSLFRLQRCVLQQGNFFCVCLLLADTARIRLVVAGGCCLVVGEGCGRVLGCSPYF